MKLSGWGKYPCVDAVLKSPKSIDDVITLVRSGEMIARGNGRAYGDSAISPGNTVSTKHLNRLLSFDDKTGQLVAEGGAMLSDIIDAFLPRGWFPYVTPGTKYVTVGGMIAADVHGKNHHKDGSFGQFVDWIEIIDSSGAVQRCSSSENKDLFDWTIGGMGLTGVIVKAAFRLRPVTSGWINQRVIAAGNIDAAIDVFEDSLDATYSVAWIDCLQTGKKLGRSLVMLGEHAETGELPERLRARPLHTQQKGTLRIPADFPVWALNRYVVKAFNTVYFWKGKRKSKSHLIGWHSYFYPLDAINDWNRIYGRRGFAQYQFVIPLENARKGLQEILSAIATSGQGSFLAVLKRFGKQKSRFSFPMEGYTLALDFHVNQKTFALMEQLDGIVAKYEGRIYLAKDSRISKNMFMKTESRAKAYAKFRASHQAKSKFTSMQSKRLGL
jgi:FAD/FMN-containing dehydrogenase